MISSRESEISLHDRSGNHRLMLYTLLCSYAYLTQLMQSEAVGSAYQTWRRNWAGPKKEYSAGAIVWQLNDTWPVSSWAIIDYFVSLPLGNRISMCNCELADVMTVPPQTGLLFDRPVHAAHYARYPP